MARWMAWWLLRAEAASAWYEGGHSGRSLSSFCNVRYRSSGILDSAFTVLAWLLRAISEKFLNASSSPSTSPLSVT